MWLRAGFDSEHICSVLPCDKENKPTSGYVLWVHRWCVLRALEQFVSSFSLPTNLSFTITNILDGPYLHPDHSWPTPPEVPRWRRTTRASWTLAGGCWHCEPSCQPFASCFASPFRTQPISSAAGCAASGLPAASPGWVPCPAAAAPGSAPGGWPWRRVEGRKWWMMVEGWSLGRKCDSSEDCTFGCGLLPSLPSSSF